jgi:Zn-dependent metalloprotease
LLYPCNHKGDIASFFKTLSPMKNLIISMLCFLFFSQTNLAQKSEARFPKVSKGTEASTKVPGSRFLVEGKFSDIPSLINMRKDEAIPEAGFKQWFKSEFNLDAGYDLQLVRSETDQLGFTHHRYQQTYMGYPVEWAIYIAHAKNSKVATLNGDAFDKIPVVTAPVLTETQALTAAMDHVSAQSYK